MNQSVKLATYFIICLALLSIELTTESTLILITYYSFVLLNLANVIRLVTIYDKTRGHENK